jgi:hypothetical protein
MPQHYPNADPFIEHKFAKIQSWENILKTFYAIVIKTTCLLNKSYVQNLTEVKIILKLSFRALKGIVAPA